jgi:hypothetical protein
MVVCDFHVISVSILPFETNPPLIVDGNAVLAFPIAG